MLHYNFLHIMLLILHKLWLNPNGTIIRWLIVPTYAQLQVCSDGFDAGFICHDLKHWRENTNGLPLRPKSKKYRTWSDRQMQLHLTMMHTNCTISFVPMRLRSPDVESRYATCKVPWHIHMKSWPFWRHMFMKFGILTTHTHRCVSWTTRYSI